jgi:cytochrome P450
MSRVASQAARVRFNPFAREFVRDPYPFYRAMQREDPYHRSGNVVVLTRYADVKQALSSPALSSASIPYLVSAFQSRMGATDLRRLRELGRKAIVFTDRPEHARLRRLVGRSFRRERLEKWEAVLVRAAQEHMRRFETGGDFMADAAGPYSLRVLLDLLGLPVSDAARIDRWTTNLRFLLEPGFLNPPRLLKISRLLDECFLYMQEVVRTRRAHPGEDLVSDLLRPDGDGDALEIDEAAYSCIMVFVAGKETTKALIGNTLHALISFPREYAQLREDPARLPAVIQEVLRFDSPLQQTKRVCGEPVRIGAQELGAGDNLLLCLGAANRDPEQFPEPDRFDPQRAHNANLAFSHGMHNCLGNHLSRLMASHFFSALVPRWRSMTLIDPDPPRINSSFILRGFQSLRVRVERD